VEKIGENGDWKEVEIREGIKLGLSLLKKKLKFEVKVGRGCEACSLNNRNLCSDKIYFSTLIFWAKDAIGELLDGLGGELHKLKD